MEVVLFRSPSDDYRECLEQDARISGVHFIPVLEERFHPPTAHEFRKWLQRYSGFIFTSKRAVETFAIGWRRHQDSRACDHRGGNEETRGSGNEPRKNVDTGEASFVKLPCYVVGPATARALRSITDLPVFGEECGTAQSLAELIPHAHSTHLRALGSITAKPLLFLCGDKRRDTVPSYFEEHRPLVEGTSIPILLEEYQAYETVPSTSIPTDLQTVLGPLLGNASRSIWLAFFSPSGVDAVWPYLEELLLKLDSFRTTSEQVLSTTKQRVRPTSIQQSGLHFAAIGPTTMEHLQTVYHIQTSLLRTAYKPSAEGLLECLIRDV